MSERMSQLLPTVRCGTCGNDVAYRELGTHLCGDEPPVPDLPGSNKLALNTAANGNRSPGSDRRYSPRTPDDDDGYSSRGRSDGNRKASGKGRDNGRHSTASGQQPSRSFLEKYNRLMTDPPSAGDDYGAESDDQLDAFHEPEDRYYPDEDNTSRYSRDRDRERDLEYDDLDGPSRRQRRPSHPESISERGSQKYLRPDDQRRYSCMTSGSNEEPVRQMAEVRSKRESTSSSAYRGRDRMNDAFTDRSQNRPRSPEPASSSYGGRNRMLDADDTGRSRTRPYEQDGYERSPSERGRTGSERSYDRKKDRYEDNVDDRGGSSRARGSGGAQRSPQPPEEYEREGLPRGNTSDVDDFENSQDSAQKYIERKYGIAPPGDSKNSTPRTLTPPPDVDKVDPPDVAPATSSGASAPLNFFKNLFTSTTATPAPSTEVVDKKDRPSQRDSTIDDLMSDLQSEMEIMETPSGALIATVSPPARNTDPDAPANRKAKCGSCRRGIYDSELAYEAVGKMFHASCFRCDECDIPLNERSRFYDIGGKVICKQHCAPKKSKQASYASSEASSVRNGDSKSRQRKEKICYECNMPITDRPVYALKRAYHERHLRCRECQNPIVPTVGHIEHEGSVYCPQDFAELFLPKCRMCNRPIDGEAVCALDGKWHPKCFGCQVCKRPFPDKSFFVFDNNPLCRRHYHEANNSICHGCNEPIEGACAQIQQDSNYGGGIVRYHPPCFACTNCQRPLNDVYYNFKGEPYCEKHIMEIQRKKNIKVERRRTTYSVLPPAR